MTRVGCTLIAAAALLGAGPPQTFRVNVEAVRVDVLVTDGHRPVGGLSASDFDLRDSGVRQQIATAQLEDVPLSVILTLDTSDSVKGPPLAHLKAAATAAIRTLMPADRASLLTFSGSPVRRSGWTADQRVLDAAIASSEAGGSTSLHDAAYAALTMREPRPGRMLVLLFTDGADTSSWLSGLSVMDIARRTEAVVYAVAVRQRGLQPVPYRFDFSSGLQPPAPHVDRQILGRPFLLDLAEETGGQFVTADSSEDLARLFVQVMSEFRSRYLLTYTPRGVDAGGWHPIEVRLNGRKGTVTARRGYLR